ncbi:MAG: YfiR family protein [Desulfobacterales bacterium]|nr:YfiR family protein [Desulfobacterales bacterium]
MICGSFSNARAAEEYAVKAAFVFNFIKFTTWPENHFKDGEAQIRLCYRTNTKLEKHFKALNGKKIGTKIIRTNAFEANHCCKSCDILFIDRSFDPQFIRNLIDKTDNRSVLIIGETDNFISQGGIINFRSKNDKLQFEISPKTAKERNIKLSSRLLKLAVISE